MRQEMQSLSDAMKHNNEVLTWLAQTNSDAAASRENAMGCVPPFGLADLQSLVAWQAALAVGVLSAQTLERALHGEFQTRVSKPCNRI